MPYHVHTIVTCLVSNYIYVVYARVKSESKRLTLMYVGVMLQHSSVLIFEGTVVPTFP